ncbi:Uncharacterised protein [Salmonella enterica subsp. salamae]|uniref:Uncharacterized protein n=1 Tax=Salmonella enterica TaxID=28901 RepID=A0A379SI31_SALER|nr:Uncharacterised protein [Salmonella enterica]SUG27880.1 Uncharacterised protein [Salmonella enterica]SUJ09268.1 Uncharacterised protein [Salmonella enterica subsp. salamae]
MTLGLLEEMGADPFYVTALSSVDIQHSSAEIIPNKYAYTDV